MTKLSNKGYTLKSENTIFDPSEFRFYARKKNAILNSSLWYICQTLIGIDNQNIQNNNNNNINVD